MRIQRGVFAAGVVIGFVAGSRAGRGTYDRLVTYSRKAVQSPPVQRAASAVSAKTSNLSRSAVTKAADMGKTAASQAPRAAGSVARKARDQVRDQVSKVPVAGRLAGHQDPATAGTSPSVNGHSTHDFED